MWSGGGEEKEREEERGIDTLGLGLGNNMGKLIRKPSQHTAGTSARRTQKQGDPQGAGAAQHLRDVGDKATKQRHNGGWRRSHCCCFVERATNGYKNKTHISTNPVNIYAGQHGANYVKLSSHK